MHKHTCTNTVEYLKNQIEEKDFLIIKEGENYNFMYKDNKSVETISCTKITSRWKPSQIHDNSVNDTITENNETLLSTEIHNASNYGNIVIWMTRIMKHNRYLRDCETHEIIETQPTDSFNLYDNNNIAECYC